MALPCYYGVSELKIRDCSQCYAIAACGKAEEFEKAVEKARVE